MSEQTELQTIAPAAPMLVVQLPIIQERLRDIQKQVMERTALAKSLVCSPETLRDVKKERAELRAEFEALEEQRKAVKKAIMAPYERFDVTYKECVSDAFTEADNVMRDKIAAVESGIKKECENRMYAFFEELKALNHLDFLRWDQAMVKVDMASAQQKTPKKLMRQIQDFVERVADDVSVISGMENAGEIMVEYKRSLNAAAAIRTVRERHAAIAAENNRSVSRAETIQQEEERVRQVEEAAKPPVSAPVDNAEYTAVFTVTASREKLVKLREFMKQEEIYYECK